MRIYVMDNIISIFIPKRMPFTGFIHENSPARHHWKENIET
jgi:hypothetical protein